MSSFAVYDTNLQQVIMVVIDTDNPSDPSFNPANSIQVPVNDTDYASMDNVQFQDYINSIVANINNNPPIQS